MTIYSQHANRGKIQILATYNGDKGITSSTVTSVDDAAAAAAIVDALNRISASATVPVSIRDERPGHPSYYPTAHLAALTDQSRRADLLAGKGEHSLWYEYAMLMLHRALSDLDTAITPMPAPARSAITAELEAEARGLRIGLYEYLEGPPGEEEEQPEGETDRQWDFEDPFVLFDGGITELSRGMRERIDRLESNLSAEHLADAAADLRLLNSVFMTVEGGRVSLEEQYLSITYEHDDSAEDGYFLIIQAPNPGHRHGAQTWSVVIDQWIADKYDSDGWIEEAHGEMAAECVLTTRPAAGELISLLAFAQSGPEQMSAWAKTPVGDALAGTAFIVTSSEDTH